MIAIGIDPGLTGALALVCSRRGLLDVLDLPVCSNGQASGRLMRELDVCTLDSMLCDLARRYEFGQEAAYAWIERPIAMPSLPASTIASQFDTFGALRALLAAIVRNPFIVNPKDWKAIYGLKSDKDAARACALRLYASAPVTRGKDHNRAEALLIAHYGLREMNG